ncbi:MULTISPECIES: LysE family transporter [unclassified Bradyrhizobium]|uniref:LysE family translocator n=1 Tax=unclassified Bradyrhizobium TaxID=2631580 RepID=UPI00247A0EA2|nr:MULTISPECIES: LysE family transporter [unclassified Bradyrhizobium]WGR71321.1 LysE family transporter [Bradyrhizobium sp. ISRA426]WGR76156.1 LysE family transporter [Bradyrhizobium sp. ISRA430]WGR86561.1 LysE family transporter [Bradyrhizobium sp. ISRA432]
MDRVALGLFLIAAIGLLGSPGPAIAALVAVGRARGLVGGLPYFLGLQLGLAMAAGITAAGLFSLLAAFPSALRGMTISATIYLVYLAYKIASSPVGEAARTSNGAHASPAAGFLLGMTNPKAYLAFASLLASYTLIKGSTQQDAFTKWILLIAVMIVVDIVWLYLGAILQGLMLSPNSERLLNVTLGLAVLIAAGLAFV